MSNLIDLQTKICDIINSKADEIICFAKTLYESAEASFFEFNTSEHLALELEKLGLAVERNLSVTGVRARSKNFNPTLPTVCLIGELDGILCPSHPKATPDTGVSHACGHHMQMAAVLATAMCLTSREFSTALGGNVEYLFVPAEEYVPIDVRNKLRSEGKITACCGKSDLIYGGEFNHKPICITTHAHMVPSKADILLGNNSCNGFISKTLTINGKASHAALAPDLGVNALDAATLGFSALGLIRSTFKDTEHIRAHFIMKEGGDVINVVPDKAVVEGQVRAKSLVTMENTSKAVDRAFVGGAYSVGANVTVTDAQGYLPVIQSFPQTALLDVESFLGSHYTFEHIDSALHNPASTDVGDLTHVVPVVNFSYGGFSGALHSSDFTITDEDIAYILPAKVMALTTLSLLAEDATLAKAELDSFTPTLTIDEYKAYVDNFYNK